MCGNSSGESYHEGFYNYWRLPIVSAAVAASEIRLLSRKDRRRFLRLQTREHDPAVFLQIHAPFSQTCRPGSVKYRERILVNVNAVAYT